MEDNFDGNPTADDYLYLVGTKFEFEDKNTIEVIQVKQRDTGPWITFHVCQGPGIPRKLLLPAEEFIDYYGHLFTSQD